MHKSKNNIYTFQTTCIKKLFFFAKFALISLTLKKVLKNIGENNFKESILHIT